MYHDTPMWNQTLNKAMWHQYLKQTKTLDYTDLLSYVPKGLKEVYIETAQFDPLRDEGIALEHLLKEAGIHVVAHHTSYTVHGYDAIPLASITKTMMQKRIEFLKETL
jgi:acetyl esterase/lipase